MSQGRLFTGALPLLRDLSEVMIHQDREAVAAAEALGSERLTGSVVRGCKRPCEVRRRLTKSLVRAYRGIVRQSHGGSP
jgi:hypothetical protein